MPINRKHNLTFIHIPKTGGVTVEKLFGLQKKDSLWCNNGKLSEGRSETINDIDYAPQHFTWDIIKKRIPEFYENSIKFTFVRNPYTKILSEYFWLTKATKFDPEVFDLWLKKFLSKIDNDHKITQTEFVPKDIDFLGRTENLNKDLNSFIKKYKLPFKYNGKILNKTNLNKNELIKKLKPDSIDLIKEIYKDDFINFNYNQ
jgi:hypothetical protein